MTNKENANKPGTSHSRDGHQQPFRAFVPFKFQLNNCDPPSPATHRHLLTLVHPWSVAHHYVSRSTSRYDLIFRYSKDLHSTSVWYSRFSTFTRYCSTASLACGGHDMGSVRCSKAHDEESLSSFHGGCSPSRSCRPSSCHPSPFHWLARARPVRPRHRRHYTPCGRF